MSKHGGDISPPSPPGFTPLQLTTPYWSMISSLLHLVGLRPRVYYTLTNFRGGGGGGARPPPSIRQCKKPGLDSEVLKNYRPVANLPFLSKVIEKAIAIQIHKHLSKTGTVA